MKKLLFILLTLIIITIIALSFIEKSKPDIKEKEDNPPVEDIKIGEKTYCYFGLDKRSSEDKGRSDVIMLINIDDNEKNVQIVSIYRDTLMDMDGIDKCNAAYATGGPNYAVNVLNKNLDLDIDGYVSSDFLAIIDVIDELGGVELDITEEEAGYANDYIAEMNKLYNKNSSFINGGIQKLDGIQAVGYARVRYTEGWDYKRTERQRTVFEQIMKEFQKANKNTKYKILYIVLTQFYTNISKDEIQAIAQKTSEYNITNTAGYPKDKRSSELSSLGSCVIPETLETNNRWLHEFLYEEKNYEPSETVKEIEQKINQLI